MKRIQTIGAIILKPRTLRELQPQIRETSFAFIKYGSAKECMPFDIQYDFRRTFRGREEVIRLKALDGCQCVKRIRLGHRDHIVGNRVDAKFTLIKVLHQVRIAKLCEIRGRVNVVGKVRAIFQAKTVPTGRDILTDLRGLIDVRVLIINVKRLYPRLTVLVFAVIDNRIESDGGSATAKVIQLKTCFDIIRDWK